MYTFIYPHYNGFIIFSMHIRKYIMTIHNDTIGRYYRHCYFPHFQNGMSMSALANTLSLHKPSCGPSSASTMINFMWRTRNSFIKINIVHIVIIGIMMKDPLLMNIVHMSTRLPHIGTNWRIFKSSVYSLTRCQTGAWFYVSYLLFWKGLNIFNSHRQIRNQV